MMTWKTKAMNRTRCLAAAGLCAIGFAGAANAAIVSVTKNFDNVKPSEDPQQGWTFGTSNEWIDTIGDNHYLHGRIDNWGVTLCSKWDGSNEWVGDKNYRDEGVVGFQFTVGGTADFNTVRMLTIFVLTDNGTPNDLSDDYGFYHTINRAYNFDGQPRTYQFIIPTWKEGTEAPDGWYPYAVGGEPPKDISWDAVITDVDRLNVGLWRPDYFYTFQNHDMGVDNIKLYVDTSRRR